MAKSAVLMMNSGKSTGPYLIVHGETREEREQKAYDRVQRDYPNFVVYMSSVSPYTLAIQGTKVTFSLQETPCF